MLFRSKSDKDRLKIAENTSFQATLYYAQGLDLEDEAEYGQALGAYRKALEANPDYTKAKERVEALEAMLEQEE